MAMDAKKQNPYTVPEGYFDSLQEKIRFRIENGKKETFSADPWNRFVKPALGMAAAFGLVFAIGFTIMKLSSGYSSDNFSDMMSIEEYDMMRAAVINGFDDDSTTTADNDLTDEEVVEYLLGEDRVMLYLAATNDDEL